jgi:2-haloacid dehalogenase/putative hydrolase of the HAD superfamily
MTSQRFDALLIDFYGTISDGDRAAVHAACQRIVKTCNLTITPADFAIAWGERFFGIIDRSNLDTFRTLYECELDSLAETLASFGVHDSPGAELVADLEAYWADPPVHRDALEFLKAVDLPICCVSNADTAPLMRAIRKHGLEFDAVVTSEDARCYKPHPAIFQRALDTLGVDANRTMHVGDSLHSDIAGALNMGISAVWIHRENRIHDIGNCEPDHTIRTLDCIFELLR